MQPSIELQELYINQRTQFRKQSVIAKWFYLAGSFFLPLISFTILIYDFRWLTLFYFLIFSLNAPLYYSIATNKDPYKYILGKSYIKINAQVLELKKTFKKTLTIHWNNVSELQVKLFSVDATPKNGKKIAVDLENLSDDNLKMVKEQLSFIKEAYQI